MLPRTKTEIQKMSETNVGANLMFALRTRTKNEPISKKQCIIIQLWFFLAYFLPSRSHALRGNTYWTLCVQCIVLRQNVRLLINSGRRASRMHSHAERGNERAKNMPEKPKLDDYIWVHGLPSPSDIGWISVSVRGRTQGSPLHCFLTSVWFRFLFV